jgi:hypothetical protein
MCHTGGWGICQWDKQHSHFNTGLGVWSGVQPKWGQLQPGHPAAGLVMVFENGMKVKVGNKTVQQKVHLMMPCTAADPPATLEVSDNKNNEFTIVLPSRFSCPWHIPRKPNPPENYRGLLEYTVTNANETFWMHEIHDKKLNRIRWDQYMHPGGVQTTLFAYDVHQRFSIVNRTHCTARPMSPFETMFSIFDIFHDHANWLEYWGRQHHRGILCDVWQVRRTFYSPRERAHIREFAEWYFATNEQIVVENPDMRHRPVAVLLASNRSHSALVGFDEHYISFIDFNDNLNSYNDRQVQLEWQWNCPGGPPRPPQPDRHDPIHDDVISSGGAAGLSVFFLVLGGAIGFGGHWYQTKQGYGAIQDH